MIALRLRIHGRVQGVGYRNWTQRLAVRLGVDGWVRNIEDGTVEIVVGGEEPVVASFIDACRRGPLLAQVDRIEETVEGAPVSAGFVRR